MKKIIVLSLFALTLIGCGKPESPVSADFESTRSEPAQALRDAPEDNVSFGEFTKNASTMPIVDTYAIWKEAERKLIIYLTPSEITDDEKSRLKAGDPAFFVFSSKESPDASKWQWYPYVVTEVTFDSDEISSQQIKRFYIMAYGIEEQNYTDNLNLFPNETEKFEYISFSKGVLSAKYSGHSSIMENTFNWNIDV